jgi:hypothetical protein
MDHASDIAAELISLRNLTAKQEKLMDECLATHQDGLEEMLSVCHSELDVCYRSQVECPECECDWTVDDSPWWLWVAIGGSVAVMFGAGIWLGHEMP